MDSSINLDKSGEKELRRDPTTRLWVIAVELEPLGRPLFESRQDSDCVIAEFVAVDLYPFRSVFGGERRSNPAPRIFFCLSIRRWKTWSISEFIFDKRIWIFSFSSSSLAICPNRHLINFYLHIIKQNSSKNNCYTSHTLYLMLAEAAAINTWRAFTNSHIRRTRISMDWITMSPAFSVSALRHDSYNFSTLW